MSQCVLYSPEDGKQEEPVEAGKKQRLMCYIKALEYTLDPSATIPSFKLFATFQLLEEQVGSLL